MSVTQRIDTQLHLVYTEFSGDVTDADFRDHLAALRANPLYDPIMSELVDLRRVSTMSVASAMVSESARWLLHAPAARRAAVAPTEVLFGMSRMYQMYLSEDAAERFAVFRTLEPALTWLGIRDASQLSWLTLDAS